jgi:putative membrane protein
MGLLIRWVILTGALLLTVKVVPGLHTAGPALDLFLASLALSALNLLVQPVLWLAKVVTMPLSCLTLGLWTLFLGLFMNSLVFYFVGTLNWGFKADGLLAAMLGALVFSIASALLNGLFALGKKKEGER